jgi:membrane-associated phospholipid phosphatase
MKTTGNLGIILSIFLIFSVQRTLAQNVTPDTTTVQSQGSGGRLVNMLPETKNSEPEIYKINYWVSVPFALVATAADIYAIPNIIKAKRDLTDQELTGLNREAFSGLDRWALEQDPKQRDNYYKSSDYVLPGVVVSAALLGFDKHVQKDWIKIFMMYYETHAITFSLYNFSPFGPAFQNKLRPVVYYDYYTLDERRGGNNRNSMYSGHTASTAAATFFMVKVYTDYHPELGRKKYLLYALATIPPLVEGYLRVKALAHFPSDNLIGLTIGAACGVMVPALHRIRHPNINLGMTATPVGPGLSFNWHPNYEHKRQKQLLLRSF